MAFNSEAETENNERDAGADESAHGRVVSFWEGVSLLG
jgi:hypothetical protein